MTVQGPSGPIVDDPLRRQAFTRLASIAGYPAAYLDAVLLPSASASDALPAIGDREFALQVRSRYTAQPELAVYSDGGWELRPWPWWTTNELEGTWQGLVTVGAGAGDTIQTTIVQGETIDEVVGVQADVDNATPFGSVLRFRRDALGEQLIAIAENEWPTTSVPFDRLMSFSPQLDGSMIGRTWGDPGVGTTQQVVEYTRISGLGQDVPAAFRGAWDFTALLNLDNFFSLWIVPGGVGEIIGQVQVPITDSSGLIRLMSVGGTAQHPILNIQWEFATGTQGGFPLAVNPGTIEVSANGRQLDSVDGIFGPTLSGIRRPYVIGPWLT